MPDQNSPPQRTNPPKHWAHYKLWERVQEVLQEIPRQFKSTIAITGIAVAEVYSFGAALGFTIEEEVVRTLNILRDQWDAEKQYGDYIFIRQPQSFPDVLLKNVSTGDIILGIELKSWYLLAKEGEPSYRFKVTPMACAPQDLLVVVPWVLSNVLSGTPIVFAPYIESARYMAEYRNHWWQNARRAASTSVIRSPSGVAPYPKAREMIGDEPAEDQGNNFERIARIGLMDTYVAGFKEVPLLGVKVARWRKFFKQKNGEPLNDDE